jgi:nucleoside 2-deoxyribosyltransferase
MERRLYEARCNMKAFIAYRFTGVPIEELRPLLRQVVDAFRRRNIDTYCSLFDEQTFQAEHYTQQDIFAHTFAILDGCDMLFVIQTTNEKSEGLLMEVGYCIAKRIPIVVAQHEHVTETYIHELAQVALRYTSVGELCAHIASLNLPRQST